MVLYFGDPQGGLALLESGIDLVGVVHGRRGGPGWRSFVPAVKHLPRWTTPDLEDPSVRDRLMELKPTLIVSCFYPRVIPQTLLDAVPGINVHPSPLPRWRGPDPCTWAIRSGDQSTALSVHWLSKGIDEGDIIEMRTMPIKARDTSGRLAYRLEADGAQMIAQVARRIIDGETMSAMPQKGEVSWAPLVPDDDWEIDWNQPASQVDALVRAAHPEPGAYTGIGNELMVILSGQVASAGRFEILTPGTPFIRDECVHILCGEGAFRLGRVRLGRRPMGGKALAKLLS